MLASLSIGSISQPLMPAMNHFVPILSFSMSFAKLCLQRNKYMKHESFVDDFVKHLLNEMGFNDGSLYAAPQMRFNLFFGETEKMATADVTVVQCEDRRGQGHELEEDDIEE